MSFAIRFSKDGGAWPRPRELECNVESDATGSTGRVSLHGPGSSFLVPGVGAIWAVNGRQATTSV